jgi:hypothetical protein
MLEPDDRHPLLDALRPPAGFALDRAVGTTFSLDLYALLTAPVAFALLEADGDEDRLASPTTILEAIRRNAGLIDVFCQAGQIALPAEYRPLVAYVEEVVHEVTASAKGRVFHPKVWVIRFGSRTGERCYRLLCLSRNLTFDHSWDTVLCLDGTPARRSRALASRNRPLFKFVDSLPRLAVRGLDQSRTEAVRELADELLGVDFELPKGFYGLRFWPLGIRGLRSWPFAEEGWTHSRLLVVSPFLSPGLLARLHAPGARDVLVSRSETLDTLEDADLNQFEEALALSAAASGSDEVATEHLGAEDEVLAERPEYPLRGLHAKLFVSEYHHMARLWTGSANATNAAFAGNVEFLVELQGARNVCGVDAVLEGQTGGVTLRDLLETYEPSGAPPPETNQQRLERRLDEARREIAALGFEATAVADEGDEEGYSLLVRAIAPEGFGGLRGVRAHLWPITLGSDGAKPLAPAFTNGIRFSPVSFPALTAFFAIELEAESRGIRASLRFVVNAILVGAPTNRHDRLLTSILRDKGDVLRYLLLLLSDEHPASMIGAAGRSDAQPGDGWAASSGLPVLESMVRALARDPERLDHVARLIKSLGASDEGRAIIPDGLEAVWEPIWAARERLRA